MVHLKALIGAGDRIMLTTLLFAALCIVLSALYPGLFLLNLGFAGTVLGCVFLMLGIPIWFTSAVQVAMSVPRGRLITTGPFRLLLHPLYTSVGLLVMPGIGFLMKSWIWMAIGVALYLSSRLFSRQEEKNLAYECGRVVAKLLRRSAG